MSQLTARSGLILSPDPDGADYAAMLDSVIGEPDGIHAYHHAIVDRLAQQGTVTAIENRAAGWQEIDRPDDIERWTRQHEPRG